MGKIFYLMGKSATGKDTIYEELQKREDLELRRLVLWTTRPIRSGETDGVEYHFTDEAGLQQLRDEGKVIEERVYQTVMGPWYYFTVDDSFIDLDRESYIAIGTIVSYNKIKKYYGSEVVIPVYIEVSDGVRLKRAMKREDKQEHPNYDEMCRRYLADQADFSEENLSDAGIVKRFNNDGDRAMTVEEITAYIKQNM